METKCNCAEQMKSLVEAAIKAWRLMDVHLPNDEETNALGRILDDILKRRPRS